jgi:hypothetical protein
MSNTNRKKTCVNNIVEEGRDSGQDNIHFT